MTLGAVPRLNVYCDGGARGNPGPAAIGVVLCDAFDNVLAEHRETIGRATNNEAEYRAVIRALELAARYTRRSVRCHLDSQLVVQQLNGEYRIREPRLEKLAGRVKERTSRFIEVAFVHVPRGHRRIRRADELVNMALDERYGRR